MECQRHNSEAVIKSMDDKFKEKEKEHRCVLNFNNIDDHNLTEYQTLVSITQVC